MILNPDLSIKSRKFTVVKEGISHRFEVVGTRSVGRKIEETIDVIKNRENGKIREVYRKDLLKW